MAQVSSPGRQRLIRESIWAVLGQLGIAVAGFAGVRLLTELAAKPIAGEAALALSTFVLGRNVFVSPFSNAQPRLHPDYALQGRANWYTREIGRLVWLSSAACAAAFCIGTLLWNSVAAPIGWTLLPPLLLTLAVESSKSIYFNRLNAERQQERFAIWMALEPFLQMGCWAFALYQWKTPEAYLYGLAAGTALSIFLLGIVFKPRYPPDIAAPEPDARRRLLRQVWDFGRPFVLVSILAWGATLADRWVVNTYLGLAEVGFYAVVAGVATKPVTIAAGALGTLMRPILYSAASEQNPARLRRAFIGWLFAALLVGIACFLLCWLASGLIASILLSPTYRVGSAPMLFWASLAFILFPATQAIEVRLMSSGLTRALVLPQALNAVSTLGTACFLIPRFGVIGAAQARAIGGAVQFALTALALLFLPPLQPAVPPVPAPVPPIDAAEATLETP